jgi:hypothetical protein
LHALGGRELAKGLEPEARIVHRPDIPREPRQADLRRRENLDLVPSDDRCAARTDTLPSVGCRPAPTTLAQMRRPDS